MEAALHSYDAGAGLAQDARVVAAGSLDGCFGALCAGITKENPTLFGLAGGIEHRRFKALAQIGGEHGGVLVVPIVRLVHQAGRLLSDRGDQVGVAMAQGIDRHPRTHVEVTAAIGRNVPRAVAMTENDRRILVVGRQIALRQCKHLGIGEHGRTQRRQIAIFSNTFSGLTGSSSTRKCSSIRHSSGHRRAPAPGE